MAINPFAQVAAQTEAISSSIRSGGVPASALYEGTIKAAYAIENRFAANKVDMVVHIELPSGYEHQVRATVLIDNKPTALNTKTQKEDLLWGYQTMTHLIGGALEGKTVADVWDSIAMKKINLYDFESRTEVPTDVRMIMDLVGKKLLIGLQRKIANKRQEIDGVWTDLPERKETLEFGTAGNINDRRTYVEFKAGVTAEDAKELDKWEKMNSGKDYDTYKEIAGAASGTPAGVAPTAEKVHDFGAA